MRRYVYSLLLTLLAPLVHLEAPYTVKPGPSLLKPVQRVLTVPELIVLESGRAGISPHIPLAIAWRESRFNPYALSATHDSGVFQLAPHTVRALHVTHPFDAMQSIIGGVGLIAAYSKMCASEREIYYGFAHGRCRAAGGYIK